MHGRSRRRGLPGPYRTFRRPQSAGDQPGPHLGLGGTGRQQPRPVHRRSAGRRIGCASAASTGSDLRSQFGQDALFQSSVADLSRVLAVIEQRLGHRIQRVVFGQSQPQIVVLGVQEGFPVPAGRDHRLPPQQHRRMGKAIALDQSCCDVAWIRRWLHDLTELANLIDDPPGAADACCLRVRCGNSQLHGQSLRPCDVISVHSGHPSAARLLHPTIERRHKAKRRQGEHPDPAVLRRMPRQLAWCSVRGTIVADNELEV